LAASGESDQDRSTLRDHHHLAVSVESGQDHSPRRDRHHLAALEESDQDHLTLHGHLEVAAGEWDLDRSTRCDRQVAVVVESDLDHSPRLQGMSY